MENASKALIMAATVLIGVVIISLAVYLFTYFNSSVNEMNKQLENGQVQKFNNQFTSYETDASGEATATIYDVITIVNLAKENNKYYGYDTTEGPSENNFYVEVKFDGVTLENETEDEITRILKENQALVESIDEVTGNTEYKQLQKYTCKVEFNKGTGRVNKISFSK